MHIRDMGENGKINVLLPGPTSYLGRRLMLKLLECPDVRLRVLAADRRTLGEAAEAIHEIVEGDPQDAGVLRRATGGIDVAYFPVRFLGAGPEFGQRRKVFSGLYRDACIDAGVRRIIFLGPISRGGVGNETIRAMIEAGEIVSARPDRIQVVWLGAGFILGSGSLLFEVLRNLVQKMPVIATPRWMETKVSVLGVRDVLDYLVQAVRVPLDGSVEVGIGLPPMSVREMLVTMARVMKLKRVFIPLPISAKRLSPYVLTPLTPFSARLSSEFLQMLASAGKTHGNFSGEGARRHFPGFSPMPFDVAVERAVDAMEHEEVISRWTDSFGQVSSDDKEAEISRSIFRDVRKEDFGEIPPENIFRAVKSIGGKEGWFSFNALWRIRGIVDKLLGGFGDSVGRRTEMNLRVGDILDIWKVIDLQENRRLLLETHMKVGGKAWLEFRIVGNTLTQTAYHYPKGLLGRLYWFSMLPFHAFIFPDMIRSIVRQAGEME